MPPNPTDCPTVFQRLLWKQASHIYFSLPFGPPILCTVPPLVTAISLTCLFTGTLSESRLPSSATSKLIGTHFCNTAWFTEALSSNASRQTHNRGFRRRTKKRVIMMPVTCWLKSLWLLVTAGHSLMFSLYECTFFTEDWRNRKAFKKSCELQSWQFCQPFVCLLNAIHIETCYPTCQSFHLI